MRFTTRVVAYLLLMDDRYPSTDEEQAVHLDFSYPDAVQELNPLASPGEMVPGDPPLHNALLR